MANLKSGASFVTTALVLFSAVTLFFPSVSVAATASQSSSAPAAAITKDQITTVKAKVLEIESTSTEVTPDTNRTVPVQKLQVLILQGQEKDKTLEITNDYVQLKKDDVFYLTKTVYADDGSVSYAMSDPYRLNTIFFLILVFVVLVIVFGGKQGIRGLASLIGSLVLILLILLPGILHGISPIFLSVVVASLIIVLGSYVTHGFNKTTTSAVIGMIVTVLVTGILAHIFVDHAFLTGFDSEDAVFLNVGTNGSIDFVGLLLGGMLIGLLGVLYDAAIGQAISVEELHHVAPHLSRWTIYKRAIRIGREHIGALVNTLAIAYVGVSLPLLLLFYTSGIPFLQVINRENFATEIVRTMIGSIGLVLAVPITTLLAVLILIKKSGTRTGNLYHKAHRHDGIKHMHNHGNDAGHNHEGRSYDQTVRPPHGQSGGQLQPYGDVEVTEEDIKREEALLEEYQHHH